MPERVAHNGDENGGKMRLRVSAVLGAMFMVMATLTPAWAHQERSSEHIHSNGELSAYGRTGTIVRGDLGPSESLISDRALEIANSPELAEARRNWDQPVDFVDQIDYQLDYRQHFDYLKDDKEHLAQLLTSKPINLGFEEMGLFLTNAEVDEMQRRSQLADRADEVTRLLGYGTSHEEAKDQLSNDNFGGIWFDQLNGGVLVLAVRDSSDVKIEELDKLLGKGSIRVLSNQPSLADLNKYREVIRDRLTQAGLRGDLAIESTPDGKRIRLTVPDTRALPVAVDRGLPPGLLIVREGALFEAAGTPGARHSWANQQPGLAILVGTNNGGEACTWGFNGHTNNQTYIVTAGHCAPSSYENEPGAWISAFEISQTYTLPMPRILTPGDTYVKSVNNSTYDFMRSSSNRADDNCSHGYNTGSGGHCQYAMQNRALHNSWETNSDNTCASLGSSNTYRCGVIVEENYDGGRRARALMDAGGGDSGSGAKYSNTIDGIITHSAIGQGEVLFNTAYDVQRILGNGYFYFNCAVGQTTQSASSWGSCPAINR